MSTDRRHFDELLVYGWIREIISTDTIPAEIMNECVNWYHIQCGFLHHNSKNILINDEGNQIKAGELEWYDCHSIYHSSILPSISATNTVYLFKIKIVKGGDGVAIGIDDAQCRNINNDFAGNSVTKNYALYHDSRVYSHNGQIGAPTPNFGINDIVTMEFNPLESTLKFIKNGNRNPYLGVIRGIYGDTTLNYRLCIGISSSNTIIELIDVNNVDIVD